MRDIHGVVTALLGMLIPTLKSIKAKGGKYMEVTKMLPNPGKKEVDDGLEELEIVRAADGKYYQASGNRVLSINDYGHMVTRMMELVG